MGFSEELLQLSERISTLRGKIQTEEATKMSMIVPFFQVLGYDIFNPAEFCPEYTADIGIKKGEKVDYAIIINEAPVILIECKSCTENLTKHSSQLFRYFSTTAAKFGILTNGIIYQFFTDLEETNKMDLVPFLEIDMSNLKESSINELKKFCKGAFDKDKIFSTAEELKYTSLIKNVLASEYENPSDSFVRYILNGIYEGQKNQRIIDKFTPIVKKAFSSFINEIVNNKISSALTKETEPEENNEDTPQVAEEEVISKIITTESELEAYYIIKGILASITPLENITYRDAESYFSILYGDNNRKPICRLKLDRKDLQLFIPDKDKNFSKYIITSLNELYTYREQLIEVTSFYTAG